MKYLVACSVFITDTGGCAPVYVDLAVYLIGILGLIGLYLLVRKLISYLRRIRE